MIDLRPAYDQLGASLAAHGLAGTQYCIELHLWNRGGTAETAYGVTVALAGSAEFRGPVLADVVAAADGFIAVHDATVPAPAPLNGAVEVPP